MAGAIGSVRHTSSSSSTSGTRRQLAQVPPPAPPCRSASVYSSTTRITAHPPHPEQMQLFQPRPASTASSPLARSSRRHLPSNASVIQNVWVTSRSSRHHRLPPSPSLHRETDQDVSLDRAIGETTSAPPRYTSSCSIPSPISQRHSASTIYGVRYPRRRPRRPQRTLALSTVATSPTCDAPAASTAASQAHTCTSRASQYTSAMVTGIPDHPRL